MFRLFVSKDDTARPGASWLQGQVGGVSEIAVLARVGLSHGRHAERGVASVILRALKYLVAAALISG